MLGGDGDRAEHAAERQRAGVAHEDRRRRRVEPEEAEAGADHRAAEHGELAGALDEVDLEIVGEDGVAREVGDERRSSPPAIITGTMARPSSPSVRLTALPAPTIDEGGEGHEEPAEIDDARP